MAINIKQLHDDLASFYPITTAQAVVGGTITEGNEPQRIDLSQYIKNEFKTPDNPGFFELYKYDDHLVRVVLEVSKNTSYNLKYGGDNIIASGIPVAYFPEQPIVLKTLTDDPNSKIVILFDKDGFLRLCLIPYERIGVMNTEINRYGIININEISATQFAVWDL